MLITDKAKFLKLVIDNKVEISLKSYADTLLFYYLGYLVANNYKGNFLEIGIGGSTYALHELSEQFDRKFHVVDYDLPRLDEIGRSNFYPKSQAILHAVDSQLLSTQGINVGSLLYSHIDGDKNYEITMADLDFCLTHLAVNGLICQDDYGNNKHPTVTDAVQELIHQNKLKMLIVGDSSCWLTTPEYYDHWSLLLDNQKEFMLLKALLNLRSSEVAGKVPKYFFMHAGYIKNKHDLPNLDNFTDQDIEYFNNLLQLNSLNYLQMPYKKQSRIGEHFRKIQRYNLTRIWPKIQGTNWPAAPISKQEIDYLPQWIKNELVEFHKLDLYEQYVDYTNFIKREL